MATGKPALVDLECRNAYCAHHRVAVSAHRFDQPRPKAAPTRGRPVPDPMAEFCDERPAPRPVAVLPTPPRRRESHRAHLAAVPRTRSLFASVTSAMWSFVLGLVCGAVLSLLGVYWFTTKL